MSNLMPAVLFNQQGSFLTSGNSGTIFAPGVNGIVMLAQVQTLTGGTAPGITFVVDEQDSFGNWVGPIFSLSAITAAGSGGETDFHGSFPGVYRVRWTVTGAPTGLTASVTLYGVP